MNTQTQPTVNGSLPATPALVKAQFLPARCGAWDVTSYPFGGDFIRPSQDVPVSNVRPSEKEGWMLADCEYPGRKGVRTICTNKLEVQP